MLNESRKEYLREHKAKTREIDKAVGIRYRTDEAYPGESFTEFKQRITTFPAWKKAPGETEKEFKRRFTSRKLKL